ncbi:hypothetical protein FD755_008376 [Muntiacus reevesi]|uniref:Nop domain-containing protein n=1 Tax=Muntiacus reevesi TaxID=9886 RepID=A0A5J5MM25_MUNRE|nr:hypothetical protein FD755_008376 [Muntiacus reevesi]
MHAIYHLNHCKHAVLYELMDLHKPMGSESFCPMWTTLEKRLPPEGLLIPYNSSCNTHILGIKKSNDKWRLVQDLQIINEAAVPLHPMVPNSYTLLSEIPKRHFREIERLLTAIYCPEEVAVMQRAQQGWDFCNSGVVRSSRNRMSLTLFLEIPILRKETLNMRVRRICCLTNLEMMPLSLGNIILLKEKGGTRGALKTRGNTPKYGLIFHSTFIGRAAAKNKEQVEERLSFYETGEIPQKNLDVMKEAMVQLEKQEKKRLKKEKKRLAAIALASSENSSAPEERKSKSPRRLFRRMEWKTHLSLFPNPKKRKSFSKEELVSSDLEETAGTGSLPKRKKSFPKEETVTDPDESENKMVPKKKRKLSKEEPLSSGPEEAAASKSSGSKKKKKL